MREAVLCLRPQHEGVLASGWARPWAMTLELQWFSGGLWEWPLRLLGWVMAWGPFHLRRADVVSAYSAHHKSPFSHVGG